jgi:hypothetical protein
MSGIMVAFSSMKTARVRSNGRAHRWMLMWSHSWHLDRGDWRHKSYQFPRVRRLLDQRNRYCGRSLSRSRTSHSSDLDCWTTVLRVTHSSNPFVFLGFTTDGSAVEPTPSQRRIELIDSISTGFGARGSSDTRGFFHVDASGNSYTYNWKIAEYSKLTLYQ